MTEQTPGLDMGYRDDEGPGLADATVAEDAKTILDTVRDVDGKAAGYQHFPAELQAPGDYLPAMDV